jgi:S-phase kinase-associated protein 1
MTEPKYYTLRPSDDENISINVTEEVVFKSMTIKNMIDDMCSYATTVAIPLHNVTHRILMLVIEFCEQNSPPDEWASEFCKKLDQETLFELILASNYLDIRSLLNATCRTVTDMIRGKTPEEIRKSFNNKNDFTPEEEDRLSKENEWCDEQGVLSLIN